MDDAEFEQKKAELDAELDKLGPDEHGGIKLGWYLYRQFRKRRLLIQMPIDMGLYRWDLPTYRHRFVSDGLSLDRDAFVVASSDTDDEDNGKNS